MEIISTWIYLDSPEESSEFPQVGKASHLPEFQKIYWRCVAVFFDLSIKNNPSAHHILFSNVPENELPTVDGLDLKSFLQEKGVSIINLPLTWQAPKGWHGKWRNQFYIFDILSHLIALPDTDTVLVLDSDCIITQPLEKLFLSIKQHGLLVLPMEFNEEYEINGLTRKGMRKIFEELDGRDPGYLPEYFGGEIFAADIATVKKINAMAPAIWESMNRNFEKGKPKFNEEAHFLSYCYHKLGNYASARPFVKRIWTSPKFNNVQLDDFKLPIWHLPAEKTGGIALVFKKIGTNLTISQLGGMLGVLKRTSYVNLKHFLKHTSLYRWWTTGKTK